MSATDPTPWEPPLSGTEAEHVLGALDRLRWTFRWKADGLAADRLAARLGPSTLTLGGLLKHLAHMEDINFTGELAGQPRPAPWDTAADPGWEWSSAADDSPEELYALWDAAVQRSRLAVTDALADGGAGAHYREADGTELTVRRLLVDMIEEYARHTGHADLIREAIDGRVGEDPPGRPYPYEAGR